MPINDEDRARIFMPFDGLKGFREAIAEKERIVVPKKELTKDSIEELSYKLNALEKGMMVSIVFYSNDEYVKTEGIITKKDLENRFIVVVKTKICIDDIYQIKSSNIKEEF